METESSTASEKTLSRRQPISLLDMSVKKEAATCVVPRLHQIFLPHASDSRRTNGRHAYQVLNRGNVLCALWHQIAQASYHPLAPRRRSREDMRRRSAPERFTRRWSGDWRERYIHSSLPNAQHQRRREAPLLMLARAFVRCKRVLGGRRFTSSSFARQRQSQDRAAFVERRCCS